MPCTLERKIVVKQAVMLTRLLCAAGPRLLTTGGLLLCALSCLPDIDIRDEMDASVPATEEDEEEAESDGTAAPGDEEGEDTDAVPEADPNDKTPPAITAPSTGCSAHETAVDDFCVGATSHGAAVRFGTDEVSTASALLSGKAVFSEESFTTDHWLAVHGLEPGRDHALEIDVKDASGNSSVKELEFSTLDEAGSIVITEILMDPAGAEPAQEFIEVYNQGTESISLSGWMIDDNGDMDGDVLPDVSLAPGVVGLIVSDSFDANSAEDASPAPDSVMIMISGSLCSSGLKNDTGESVQLYDAAGGLMSAFPNLLGKHSEGCSAQRIDPGAPDEDPANWQWDPQASSTPGSISW